ncbi:hypothetical protein EDWATA_03085 [Edwardsiella tarda ATCC 23685]|uniref:Uncharacterized protein n=1 Tax=Edwardsiella tarda ATCC 23685 TaxID=500638 RepID=D4F8J2_EDWTA|nr:hypothetical protein EDWATA_03085 [Edwardsiella tarda ATCC 23685]
MRALPRLACAGGGDRAERVSDGTGGRQKNVGILPLQWLCPAGGC